MQARTYTPLFNTQHISSLFTHPMPLDDKGLFRPLETILFPGAEMKILKHMDQEIVQVSTKEYPAGIPLFTDVRFMEEKKATYVKTRPSLERFLEGLHTFPQAPYVWGGNRHQGIKELLAWYPPPDTIDESVKKRWQLQGVDCSGLLYEISEGTTPRNTRELIFFERPILIEGKTEREIACLLLPADLIVWRGHVLIVGGDGMLYESRHPEGVCKTPLLQRLQEIHDSKIPSNDPTFEGDNRYFVRRWYH